METVKITAIGNSAGIILSKEILAKMHVQKGDLLSVCETPDGVALAPYDEGFEFQMNIAERIMRQDRDILRKLAE